MYIRTGFRYWEVYNSFGQLVCEVYNRDKAEDYAEKGYTVRTKYQDSI